MTNARNGQIRAWFAWDARGVVSDGNRPRRPPGWSGFAERNFGEIWGHVHGQVSAKSRAIEGKSRRFSFMPAPPTGLHVKSRRYKIVRKKLISDGRIGLLVDSRYIGGQKNRCRS